MLTCSIALRIGFRRIAWRQENYCENPPPADGRKVIISDTDHLFGIGGNRAWVWKSFTRGLNPIFMDPVDMPQWEAVRQTMGMTLAYANRMDLSAVKPHGDLASSGYCLANPGEEYLTLCTVGGSLAGIAALLSPFNKANQKCPALIRNDSYHRSFITSRGIPRRMAQSFQR